MSEVFGWITMLLVDFAIVIGIMCMISWIDIRNKKIRLDESKFLAEFDYLGNKNLFNTFLDDFINDCMKDYVMYYIIPDANLTYITKDRENQIRNGLKELVVNRLSESLKKKITLIYSEIFFNQILAEKIFYVVTIYVADFNSGNQQFSVSKRSKPEQPPIDESDDWGEYSPKKK